MIRDNDLISVGAISPFLVAPGLAHQVEVFAFKYGDYLVCRETRRPALTQQ
jgi:hypothetical protein